MDAYPFTKEWELNTYTINKTKPVTRIFANDRGNMNFQPRFINWS